MGRTLRVELRPEWLIALAISLLIIPLRWIAAVLLAAVAHELCHILAIRLQKMEILSLELDLFGAKISTGPMQMNEEIISAAAGPMGSLLLVVFLRIYPELALCGIFQGLYNLLPIFPYDGGRILRCVADRFFPNQTYSIEKAVNVAALLIVLFLALGVLAIFPRWSVVILLLFFPLLWKLSENFLAKMGH